MTISCNTMQQQHIGVMWKTVSEDCNLACDYCYYSTCGGQPGRIKRIDDALLDKFMKEFMEKSKGIASFAWQGGEPLLAGIDFFQRVVSLQAQYAPPHTVISNALQTNGTLITAQWASFFKQYRFLIGVSVDGPQYFHDMHRINAAGQGSFSRVMKGIDNLRHHQVDFNVLTVIHQDNVHQAQELLAFYEQEQFHYIQFIPCMDFRSQQIDAPGVYKITPEQYGQFLCDVFDIWYNDGQPKMSIRFFDNLLSVYVNRDAELCSQRQACPIMLVFEQNGDAFPCDFYINDRWRLGNIGTDSLNDLLTHPLYDEFLKLKPTMPEKCTSCRWLKLCHGGCPRNRDWLEQTEPSVDYFCESYQRIYEYADEKMRRLGKRMRNEWFQQGVNRYYGGKIPGRNEPCACGSGRKYKRCCAVE